MLLRATYQLTIKDFETAQILHGGWNRRFLQILGIVMMLSALFSLWAHQYFQGLIPLLLGFFLLFGTRLLYRRAFKKEPSLQRKTETVVSHDGIVMTTAAAETKLNWSAYVGQIENENVFLLYLQTRLFQIIPKRAFPPDDVVRLRELFGQHISKQSPNAGSSSVRKVLLAIVIVAALVLVYFAIHAGR